MSNDVIKEQLSAYVDNELPEEEQVLLLRRLEKEPALRRQLSRYQLMQDAINRHLPEKVDFDFSDRVMSAIESEPNYQISNGQVLAKWLKPVSGFFVAASVAMLAIIGGQSLLLNSYRDNIASDSNYIAGNQLQYRSQMRWNVQQAEIRNRLNSYLVNHNEYTSSLNIQGMLPYVRIAGYDLEQATEENTQKQQKENNKEK